MTVRHENETTVMTMTKQAMMTAAAMMLPRVSHRSVVSLLGCSLHTPPFYISTDRSLHLQMPQMNFLVLHRSTPQPQPQQPIQIPMQTA